MRKSRRVRGEIAGWPFRVATTALLAVAILTVWWSGGISGSGHALGLLLAVLGAAFFWVAPGVLTFYLSLRETPPILHQWERYLRDLGTEMDALQEGLARLDRELDTLHRHGMPLRSGDGSSPGEEPWIDEVEMSLAELRARLEEFHGQYGYLSGDVETEGEAREGPRPLPANLLGKAMGKGSAAPAVARVLSGSKAQVAKQAEEDPAADS
jgi:hypothetical protein